jgi:hypothetical protein
MVEPEVKPEPLIVRLNAGPPAVVNAGDMVRSTGMGLPATMV